MLRKYIKINLISALVFLGLFLFVFDTSAATYSCEKDGVCWNIPNTNYDIAQCASEGGDVSPFQCKVYACVIRNVCQDISTHSNLTASVNCARNNGRFFTKKCSQLKKYGCVASNQCTNIFVDDYNDSGCEGQLLRGLCPTYIGDCEASGDCAQYSCVVITDPEKKFKTGDCRDFKSANEGDAIAQARNLCASTLAEADQLKIYKEPCAGSDRDPNINRGQTVDELFQQAATTLNPSGVTSINQFIGKAINILMAFIGSITLLLYVFSGFLWMTASGNSEQVDKAKRILIWTTLGVAVMLFSYILVNLIFNSIPK